MKHVTLKSPCDGVIKRSSRFTIEAEPSGMSRAKFCITRAAWKTSPSASRRSKSYARVRRATVSFLKILLMLFGR